MSDNTRRRVGAARNGSCATHPQSTGNGPTATTSRHTSLSFCHMLKTMMQSLGAGAISILKGLISAGVRLRKGRTLLITMAFQSHRSMLPSRIWSACTLTRSPSPILMVGMGFTLVGLLLMFPGENLSPDPARRGRVIGMGSSVFHPEPREWRGWAAGGPLRPRAIAVPGRRQHGSAQCRAPPHSSWCRRGQHASCAVSPAPALIAMAVMFQVGGWLQTPAAPRRSRDARQGATAATQTLPARARINAVAVWGSAVLQEGLSRELGLLHLYF